MVLAFEAQKMYDEQDMQAVVPKSENQVSSKIVRQVR